MHGEIELVDDSSIINQIVLNCVKSHLILICGWQLTRNFIHGARWLRILLICRVIDCLLLITVLLILLMLGASFAGRQEKTLTILDANSSIIGGCVLGSCLIAKLLLLQIGILLLAALWTFGFFKILNILLVLHISLNLYFTLLILFKTYCSGD